MPEIKSSNVESVSHHGTTLTVKFKSGGEYDYEGVPADVYNKMMLAKSIGSFFHTEIKGQYPHTKKEEKK